MYRLVFFNILYLVVQTYGQNEGDVCLKDNLQGVCTNIRSCKTATDDIKFRRGGPQICSFQSTDPIVCCLDNARQVSTQRPVLTKSPRPRTTTEYVPPMYDYVSNDKSRPSSDGCEAIPPNMTAAKTGQKAWDKCIEYQHKLVYPCERGVALGAKQARGNNCKHNGTELIVGGTNALPSEFPHMVLLGLENKGKVKWACGGTVLSEKFILTAGHCTSSREYGKLRYARTGVSKRTDPFVAERLYKITNIHKHPDYKPPAIYNDIALVETDREIVLDQSVVPACLDTGSPNNYEKAIATGWGATAQRGPTSEQLQKVVLEKFSTSECMAMFPPNDRRMLDGFDDSTQLCYGDRNEKKDTCQGDSGGPLQLYHQQVDCMYTVVGVTSFGRRCAEIGEPGVYTRVATYVPWIESIVWP